MAERTFDYEKIAEIYKSMQTITGDAGTPDSIAGNLELANKEMETKCGVEDEAIFGPLADQLSLNWNNFASNFPNFVANFNNWATVVSNASGQYQKFEEDVAALRKANPLGFASEGRTMNYISDSYYQKYSDANLEQFETDLANMGSLHELTGADYSVAGASSRLKKHKFWGAMNIALYAVGGIVALEGAFTIYQFATKTGAFDPANSPGGGTPPSTPPSDPPSTPPSDPPSTPPSDPPSTPPSDPPSTPPSDPPSTPPSDPPSTPPSDPPSTPPSDPPSTPPSSPPSTPPSDGGSADTQRLMSQAGGKESAATRARNAAERARAAGDLEKAAEWEQKAEQYHRESQEFLRQFYEAKANLTGASTGTPVSVNPAPNPVVTSSTGADIGGTSSFVPAESGTGVPAGAPDLMPRWLRRTLEL